MLFNDFYSVLLGVVNLKVLVSTKEKFMSLRSHRKEWDVE